MRGWGLSTPRPPAPSLGPALQVQGEGGRMTSLLIHSLNTAALAPELSPDQGGPARSNADPGRAHRATLWAGSDRLV